MSEKTKLTVEFDKSKEHAWIDGHQYVSLDRFLEVKSDNAIETRLLNDRMNELLEENEAYKVLLRKQLNKEDEPNGAKR